MPKPASRFDSTYQPVNLAPPVKDRLTVIKQQMEADKRRQVTYSEVTEWLLDRWDATGGLIVQVEREAGR